MSENEWKITKTGPHCRLCNTDFQPGVAYYSVLLQNHNKPGSAEENKQSSDEFERSDFCVSCFQSQRPSGVYYYWKTTLVQPDAVAKKPKTVVDVDHVFEFFKRLEGDNGSQKISFRYILALILARKKVLLATERKKDADGRPVQVYREKGGAQDHLVTEPELSVEEIQGLSDQLGVLLGMAPAKPAQEGSVAQPEM